MSDAASTERDGPHGTGLLARQVTEAELDGAPFLASLDDLVIEDLGDDESVRFLDALEAE